MGKKSKDFEITDFNDDQEEISKTQKKQMAAEFRELAKTITEMPKSKRDQLDLPTAFLDAIEEARRITSHIAKKRHYQYMGKLLIKLDHVAIQEGLQRLYQMDGHYQVRDEVINAWIEHLPEQEKAMLDHLYDSYELDAVNNIRQALRTYRKKPDQINNRKKLFQALRQLDKQTELINPLTLI